VGTEEHAEKKFECTRIFQDLTELREDPEEM
jgi:hypothetical protein